MNLLVVEDEVRVADFIQRGLKAEGWTVTVASNGESALTMLEDHDFDAVLLDLMLPGKSGQDVCRLMRARRDLTPVLILTALDGVEDLVAGLKLGADDYLAKPFNFDELIARVQALVRRRQAFSQPAETDPVLRCEGIEYDTRSLQVRCHGELVELTEKEREILKLLIADPGRVFTRERILNTVWGAIEMPMTNVVDVYVGRLRRKLGAAGDSILTVRGRGYRLARAD